MKGLYMLIVLTVTAVSEVVGDVYLHNPRGSNNRINEGSANRQNANRVFDSQNNNRGGYNVGDATQNSAGGDQTRQYKMEHFQSSSQYKVLSDGQGRSFLTFEWTNQHGCGGNEDTDPHKQNCNLVFQYMCTDHKEGQENQNDDLLRDGGNQNRPQYQKINQLSESENQYNSRVQGSLDVNRVRQEPFAWYDSCYIRERNKGLFTADQNLDNNRLKYSSAIHTRQNPNGDQYGYECPEERDYYPYWHPSPWKDIAILAENATLCKHYQDKSFNVQPYHECVETFQGTSRRRPYSRWNNEADCSQNGGTWTLLYNYLEKAVNLNSESACVAATSNGVRYIWALPYDSTDGKTKECLVALDKPECTEAPWSRSNHLGNGRQPEANNYTWTLPFFPSGKTMRCVARLRYNISTDDYDPYATDASKNQNKAQGIQSPVQQNPYVKIDADSPSLRLAINTAQFGRVFQDRTHVFKLSPRPNRVNTQSQRIYNLNVRGKRGNIVQVYPAVEYDFFPTELNMKSDEDLVHIQWTGSNSHQNGNPGGDGQTGDAGEGQSGTDRNNMVIVHAANLNYPAPYENTTFWNDVEAVWIHHNRKVTAEDLAIGFASSGYFECMNGCDANPGNKGNMQVTLNNAPASYPGALLRVKKKGTYHYICTRNNNFTNRSQKGRINVL